MGVLVSIAIVGSIAAISGVLFMRAMHKQEDRARERFQARQR